MAAIVPVVAGMEAVGSLDTEGNRIAAVVDTIDDPAGTFYRFSLPGSILRRKVL